MSESNRQNSVIRNVGSQMRASLVQSLLGFVARKIFLVYLGQNLLGLNSLLVSVIGMLSIAELGVGEAINFSLYEPLAKNDHKQVAAIMRLYKKMYAIIGAVVGVLGVALLPCIHLLIDVSVPMNQVYTAYGLMLLNGVLSYYVAYKRSIISADQKDYIVVNVDTIAQIIMVGIQIAVLLLTKNYYLYLIVQVVCTLARNIYLSVRANKMYPYMADEDVPLLSKEYKEKFSYNVKALLTIKLAVFCVSGTDNMLLSGTVSLAAVAIFNNYTTVINLLNKTFNTIFLKANAIIGNYLVFKNKEESYTLFKRINFMNFLITSYTSIGIMVVCNQVISVWLGAKYTWAAGILALLVYNNYSRYILQTCEAFRSAAGLYSPVPMVKFLALLEGLVNLGASVGLILVMENDIAAVFIGTAISTVVSTVGVPWIVYRFLFERPLREYFAIYFKQFAVMLAALVGSGMLFNLLSTGSHLLNIIIGIFICTIVTGGVYTAIFWRTDEFKYNLNIGLRFVRKKLHR